ncbi:hypothetical protein B0H15DRAFT_817863 [Mycena belliarum]|uniref:SMAD/FHA domain-containing protein n=1 Tax=Mycena belliarum TaxID=1033014 RepID=A0AAD6XY54_9AGAR|nr:hypothetical protein B0H15DRAFT_817863 [Mycena belliae]
MDGAGTDSPPPRTTILGSFLGRGRPRNSSQSHIDPAAAAREMSPSPPTGFHAVNPFTPGSAHSPANVGPPSPIPVGSNRRRPPAPAQGPLTPSTSAAGGGAGLTLSHMLRRRRSAGNVAPAAPSPPMPAAAPTRPGAPPTAATGATHRLRLVPHLDSRRSLRFDPIARDLREAAPALRIGRFTDRSGLGLAAANTLANGKIAFKSKVVSRAHAEVWVEGPSAASPSPVFYIRDTKSSSGTFLNHVRLSPAGTESRAHQIKDGDILQLGVDYQGGAEDIYKSVKIRIEVGREWQSAANAFNTNALKNLKTLAIAAPALVAPATSGRRKAAGAGNIPDCCICLFPVSIRQALFIAPCSHAFHYKCLRPLLEAHHPAFSCPLCRTFADLEEDVEVEAEEDDDEFENPAGFPTETLASPVPGVEHEGVLADDLEDGDEVDELYAGPPRMRAEGGAETEVEDNGGGVGMHMHPRDSHHQSEMDEDMHLPPLPDDVEMELDAESGEGSGSAEGGRRVSGEGTLGAKRKR